MHDRLKIILAEKVNEVAALKARLASKPESQMAKILRGDVTRESSKQFKDALSAPGLSVIAEIKRQSPSKGKLADIPDPLVLAEQYVAGGAHALSILTDEKFFGGHLRDLETVAKKLTTTPLLRKDFTIDVAQIAEAIVAGADAVLCIVAVLKEKTRYFLEQARRMNIDVLVEVHDRHELDIAIKSGADIIGINHRDLTTFEIFPERSLELLPYIPKNIITVAESGMTSPEVVRQYGKAGFNAVLIGEALVKSGNPVEFIHQCR